MISDRISPHLVRITPGATSLCNRSGHMSQPARGRGAGGRQDTSGDLGTDRRKGPAAPPARAGPDTAPLNHIRMLHGAGRSWELQLKGQLLAGPLPSGLSSGLSAVHEHCPCLLQAQGCATSDGKATEWPCPGPLGAARCEPAGLILHSATPNQSADSQYLSSASPPLPLTNTNAQTRAAGTSPCLLGPSFQLFSSDTGWMSPAQGH